MSARTRVQQDPVELLYSETCKPDGKFEARLRIRCDQGVRTGIEYHSVFLHRRDTAASSRVSLQGWSLFDLAGQAQITGGDVEDIGDAQKGCVDAGIDLQG